LTITPKRTTLVQKKIARHLAYIEERTNEYLAALEQNDLTEKSVEKVKKVIATKFNIIVQMALNIKVFR
jgi:hypothetical protein